MRRSLRIRQLNSRPASIAIASPSANTTSKLVRNAAKKRTRTKIMAEDGTSVNDVAVQPKLKKMKPSNDNNDSIGPFVLLPTEVLERIFMKADDFGFSNLADTCTRFESIALAVALKRYADRYFVINCDQFGGDRDIYGAIFNRFGSYIDAIEMNHITDICVNHWMIEMLRPHINHITKLTFDNCTFKRRENIFSQIMRKITHLAVRNDQEVSIVTDDDDIDLLECRKLVKLDIRGLENTSSKTLEQIICNNPGLQSIYKNSLDPIVFQNYSTSDHLNQFKEVGSLYSSWEAFITPGAMDGIVHTLRNLESLELIFFQWIYSGGSELFMRLGLECKRIKRLKLDFDDQFRWDHETIKAIRSFQQIEYLHLSGACSRIDKILLIVEYLRSLHHLRIDVQTFPFVDILPLFYECSSLETITVSLKDVRLKFINTQFFDDFLQFVTFTERSNAQIEIEKLGKTVAVMNANGIVCRNKLIHWIGCDNIPESSDTHLLKLTNELVKSDEGRKQSQEPVQRHLLDRIFEYLDVTSLYLFAETSPRSKQLVENYIKMHSKRSGLFTMTNEFYALNRFDQMHRMFAPYVTNLKVYNFDKLRHQVFLQNYTLLTKISIFDETISGWLYPRSLRHLILDGSEFIDYLELFELLGQKFEKYIDILELKNASSFIDYKDGDHDGIFNDSKVITLKFNYRGETQFKHFKKLFKGAKTKLVPILPSSNHF